MGVRRRAVVAIIALDLADLHHLFEKKRKIENRLLNLLFDRISSAGDSMEFELEGGGGGGMAEWWMEAAAQSKSEAPRKLLNCWVAPERDGRPNGPKKSVVGLCISPR